MGSRHQLVKVIVWGEGGGGGDGSSNATFTGAALPSAKIAFVKAKGGGLGAAPKKDDA